MTSAKKSITDLQELEGKRVFVREDLNVPFNEQGQITDDTRIQAALPTLRLLLEKGARVIVASHLGRPKGKVEESLRLTPLAEALAQLLPQANVKKTDTVIGPDVEAAVNALQPGELLLLENVRFEAGEEKNELALAKAFAQLADIYVNDAFGTAHRAHASTEGIARQVPVAVAGLLMEKELAALGGVLSNPKRPFTAIIGGSKISTKISVLTNLLEKVDTLIIGGGMAYTFLLAQGYRIGNSIHEKDFIETARDILAKAEQRGVNIVLSQDIVVADKFGADANTQTVSVTAMPDGWEGMDVGPQTRERMSKAIADSKTILWNGPVGVFEMAPFKAGTEAIAEAVAKATQAGAQTILGGGDTVAAIEQFGYEQNSFTHVSTGGGASLEFLEGKTLPGVAALQDKAQAAAV